MRFPQLARQYISNLIKRRNKMIAIKIGYNNYVMENEKAVQLLALLESAEVYENKYHRSEEGRDSFYTHHVYANEDNFTMELIPTAKYQLAKLAGKPSKD